MQFASLFQASPCTCSIIGNKSVTNPSKKGMLYFLLERHKAFFTCFHSATLLILSTLPYHSHLPLLCSACLHLFSRGYIFLTAPANWRKTQLSWIFLFWFTWIFLMNSFYGTEIWGCAWPATIFWFLVCVDVKLTSTWMPESKVFH